MSEWTDPEAGLRTVDVMVLDPREPDAVRNYSHGEVRTARVCDAGSGFLLLEFVDGAKVGYPLAVLLGWEVCA